MNFYIYFSLLHSNLLEYLLGTYTLMDNSSSTKNLDRYLKINQRIDIKFILTIQCSNILFSQCPCLDSGRGRPVTSFPKCSINQIKVVLGVHQKALYVFRAFSSTLQYFFMKGHRIPEIFQLSSKPSSHKPVWSFNSSK